jgi:hypothetical protein
VLDLLSLRWAQFPNYFIHIYGHDYWPSASNSGLNSSATSTTHFTAVVWHAIHMVSVPCLLAGSHMRVLRVESCKLRNRRSRKNKVERR